MEVAKKDKEAINLQNGGTTQEAPGEEAATPSSAANGVHEGKKVSKVV